VSQADITITSSPSTKQLVRRVSFVDGPGLAVEKLNFNDEAENDGNKANQKANAEATEVSDDDDDDEEEEVALSVQRRQAAAKRKRGKAATTSKTKSTKQKAKKQIEDDKKEEEEPVEEEDEEVAESKAKRAKPNKEPKTVASSRPRRNAKRKAV